MTGGSIRPQPCAANTISPSLHPSAWRASSAAYKEGARVSGMYARDNHQSVDALRVQQIHTGRHPPGPLHVMSAIRMLRPDAVGQALDRGAIVPAEVVEKLAYTVTNAGAEYGHCMFEREYTRRARPIEACLKAAPNDLDSLHSSVRKQQILVYLALAGVRPTLWERCLLLATPHVRWPTPARRSLAPSATTD